MRTQHEGIWGRTGFPGCHCTIDNWGEILQAGRTWMKLICGRVVLKTRSVQQTCLPKLASSSTQTLHFLLQGVAMRH